MLVSIPLTDDERAAVEDGQTALDTLLARLAASRRRQARRHGKQTRHPARPACRSPQSRIPDTDKTRHLDST